MPTSHRSARLVAWANAVTLGLASPDLAAAEITGADGPHRVDGLPGGDEQTLPVVLARLRASGGRPARLALPVPGDVAGVPGPGPLTAAALAAGEVALVGGWGLVPSIGVPTPRPVAGGTALGRDVNSSTVAPSADPLVGPGRVAPRQRPGCAVTVRWTAFECPHLVPELPTLAEADQALAVALRHATEVLDRLDVARWQDPDAEELAALRNGRLDGDGLAPGYPDRAARVLVRARRLRTIVALASRDDGAAVTAAEAAARSAALRPLDRAARHAEMAAYNAVADGPGADR